MTRLPKLCNLKHNFGESTLDFLHRGYDDVFSSQIFFEIRAVTAAAVG